MIRPEKYPERDAISGALPATNRWLRWFNAIWVLLTNLTPSVGQDVGDADTTLTFGKSASTQIYASPLTAPRTVTLSTIGALNGSRFRVVRQTTATGASGLSVGGLKTLAVGEWCDVEFSGTAWILTTI